MQTDANGRCIYDEVDFYQRNFWRLGLMKTTFGKCPHSRGQYDLLKRGCFLVGYFRSPFRPYLELRSKLPLFTQSRQGRAWKYRGRGIICP